MAVRYAIFLFLACALDPRVLISSDATNVNITRLLDNLLTGYDKRVRPNHGGSPVEVGVNMYIMNIGAISDSKMDFTFDLYFRQFWTDPRLSFSSSIVSISLGPDFADKIWLPDTFFVNEKQSTAHLAASSIKFIRINPSGAIKRSVRMTVAASCAMNLQYYPMDRQLCNLEIESFGHTMRDIQYKWNEGPNSVGVSSDLSMPQFKVLGYRQRAIEIQLTTGNYSRLAVEFQFARSFGHHVLQIYIPSAMFVILSWVSFWLNRNATTARVALGTLSIFAISLTAFASNVGIPKVSYIKAIDLYLGICCLMAFASLLEYATISYLTKRIQMRNKDEQNVAEQKKADLEMAPSDVGGDHGNSKSGPRDSEHHLPKEIEGQFKAHDPKVHSKGDTIESPVNGGKGDEETGLVEGTDVGSGDLPTSVAQDVASSLSLKTKNSKGINELYGINPSNLDKYSRIIFPSCFAFFNFMYWIIFLRISDVVADDLILLE